METHSINRRKFIKSTSIVAGGLALPGVSNGLINGFTEPELFNPIRVSQLKKPVAIAMWDYSWILRHHKFGEFENWDKVLNELAERGYNAIRIDAMPQFIARDSDGVLAHEFRSVKDGWKPSLWGNDYTMTFQPREALLEFLPKCKNNDIKVGLATWFSAHGTKRKDIFLEEGGLLRAWDETLSFLASQDLLDNVIYVDLLNEYPNWHGYEWLKNKLKESPDYYNEFIQSMIITLKAKYPDMDFFASLDSGMALDKITLENFDALDYHIWFAHTGKIPGLGEINSRDQTLDYRQVYSTLIDFWRENKSSMVDWMDGRISDISSAALKNNIVCGNTEGWGPIFWFDHPELNWNWVKESAEICVDLALKHENYKFICTSNFTHPQFKGIWDDVAWHRKLTARIKA
jgi:hypothetical protein